MLYVCDRMTHKRPDGFAKFFLNEKVLCGGSLRHKIVSKFHPKVSPQTQIS